MSATGIIAGALGGGAQALQGMAQQDLANEGRSNLAKEMADIDFNKAKALEDYKAQMGDRQRVKMANDINEGVDAQLAAESKDGPVSDERRGLVRRRVAEERGYLSPKDAAATDYRDASLAATNARADAAITARKEINDADNVASAARNKASIDAALERAGLKGDGTDSRVKVTSALNSVNQAIKSHEEGSRGRTPEERAAWQETSSFYRGIQNRLMKELDSDTRPAAKNAIKRAQAKSGGGEPGAASTRVIKTRAEYDQLPSGATYQAPDGSVRTKN